MGKKEREFEYIYTHTFHFIPSFLFFLTSLFFSPFCLFFRRCVYKENWNMKNNDSNTPVAYCNRCKVWTPLAWLPADQRGRRAETWFCCAACGGKSYQLRDLTEAQARAKNKAAR